MVICRETCGKCGEHVINMWLTCGKHVVNMLWTWCEHVVNIQWTCCEHAVNMRWTCGERVVNMSWTFHWTCLEHVNMLWTYREHVVKILWTWGGEGPKKINIFFLVCEKTCNSLRSKCLLQLRYKIRHTTTSNTVSFIKPCFMKSALYYMGTSTTLLLAWPQKKLRKYIVYTAIMHSPEDSLEMW